VSARLVGFAQDKLKAEATTDVGDGKVLRVHIEGTASQRDVTPLEELFAAIHEASAGGGVTEVELDLRAVEYMNSSHFKTLVGWLGRMAKLTPRVPVRLLANEKHHWQKRSLHALPGLGEGLLTIEM
jgi:hypothetical protein